MSKSKNVTVVSRIFLIYSRNLDIYSKHSKDSQKHSKGSHNILDAIILFFKENKTIFR